jgi:non-canonical (house-cleaning) NTP pyrophosphatase
MRIAIATTGPDEVEAVKEAWKVFGASIADERDKVEFLRYSLAGDARRLPLSLEELMDAARSGAENLILQLKRERAEADFYVDLQTGFQVVGSEGPRRQVFLLTLAYVTDGHKGFFGHGPGLVMPSRVSDPIIDRGIELSIAVDRISGSGAAGTGAEPWGILTRDILGARHVCVLALISAFAPFYNPEPYGA